MSYLSTEEAFTSLRHFTAEWLPSHTGQGGIRSGGAAGRPASFGFAFVADERKDSPVLASFCHLGLAPRARCSLGLVALFLSLLSASGENTGSFATFASFLTKWMKSLNPMGS